MLKNFTEFRAHVEAIQAALPRLSEMEYAQYEKICTRLQRAEADKRRGTKRDDAKTIAAADRAIARATAARDALIKPYVDPRWAPSRIIYKSDAYWTGPAGGWGKHHQECEMVLDHKDLSGPTYRTVRVLKDEGAPPTNARPPFQIVGVAWHAIRPQIDRGHLIVLDEDMTS